MPGIATELASWATRKRSPRPGADEPIAEFVGRRKLYAEHMASALNGFILPHENRPDGADIGLPHPTEQFIEPFGVETSEIGIEEQKEVAAGRGS